MRPAGQPVEILVVNGFDDSHRLTEERLRLARLANAIEIVTGPEDGLRRLLRQADAGTLPGGVFGDLDLDEAEQLLDGIRRATDLADLPVIVLDDGSVDLDVRSGSTTVRVPRPAGFADLMGAANSFDRFRFDVEMREFPERYSAWMWLRTTQATVDKIEIESTTTSVPAT